MNDGALFFELWLGGCLLTAGPLCPPPLVVCMSRFLPTRPPCSSGLVAYRHWRRGGQIPRVISSLYLVSFPGCTTLGRKNLRPETRLRSILTLVSQRIPIQPLFFLFFFSSRLVLRRFLFMLLLLLLSTSSLFPLPPPRLGEPGTSGPLVLLAAGGAAHRPTTCAYEFYYHSKQLVCAFLV